MGFPAIGITESQSGQHRFEAIYTAYNHRKFIHPDPLEFVVRFDDPADQEIAGLIAATLAFGRVKHILKSLERVFSVFKSPAVDAASMSRSEMRDALGSFRHRWTSGEELASLLSGVRRLREDHGSLASFFTSGLGDNDVNVIDALIHFVAGLKAASGMDESTLLSCPTKGSACKRLLLYLRWMIRKDNVDPGPWTGISPSLLVVPMDTHMHRVSRAMELTSRKYADMKCALEVTDFFRSVVPEDPVKYDFSLTRPGIRGDRETGIRRPLKTDRTDFC